MVRAPGRPAVPAPLVPPTHSSFQSEQSRADHLIGVHAVPGMGVGALLGPSKPGSDPLQGPKEKLLRAKRRSNPNNVSPTATHCPPGPCTVQPAGLFGHRLSPFLRAGRQGGWQNQMAFERRHRNPQLQAAHSRTTQTGPGKHNGGGLGTARGLGPRPLLRGRCAGGGRALWHPPPKQLWTPNHKGSTGLGTGEAEPPPMRALDAKNWS